MEHLTFPLSLELVLVNPTGCARPFLKLRSVGKYLDLGVAELVVSESGKLGVDVVNMSCYGRLMVQRIFYTYLFAYDHAPNSIVSCVFTFASASLQGWMSFRCGSDGLTSALSKSSAVVYFVSQLPDGNIGKKSEHAVMQNVYGCAKVVDLYLQSACLSGLRRLHTLIDIYLTTS